MALSDEQVAELKNTLKRCSSETIEAAIEFRNEGNLDAIPVVVYGIIQRYLPVEAASKLEASTDKTRLIEDLGIDSLTMLEIVLSIEEALALRIENEELREIQTLGDVKEFIKQKAQGISVPAGAAGAGSARSFDRYQIMLALPQQPPFLFLDSAEIEGDVIRASYRITGEEHFLEGHFKDNPVFPASIVFEALGQAACLWVLEEGKSRVQTTVESNEIVFASMDGAHFYKRAKPGDVLEMEQKLTRLRSPVALFSGTVTVNGVRVAKIEQLVLAFGEEAAAHLNGEAAVAEKTGTA
jgi:acyl carrier protein